LSKPGHSLNFALKLIEMTNYQRIEQAIGYIAQHFQAQPSLDEVAAAVHLSPFHFQRLFTDWAGVSPKKFLQFVTLEHAKQLLTKGRANLIQVADESGLSGPSRLHDLFVGIEAMTPHEYRNGGEALDIVYHFQETPFGEVLAAATPRGVCDLQFVDSKSSGQQFLEHKWHGAALREGENEHTRNALRFFKHTARQPEKLRLHLKGTDFQLKVWAALLRIPEGQIAVYGDLADAVGMPKATRAVGTAVGDNPVAYIIPCHRVIRKAGGFGEYRWGSARKTALLGWESCLVAGNS
jgi:AraC family transcriptional regulator, regulatory protein of adaptative response / methylated-DNA-[protein]-cysteine methyltransferase